MVGTTYLYIYTIFAFYGDMNLFSGVLLPLFTA